jgi:hypothetical protein
MKALLNLTLVFVSLAGVRAFASQLFTNGGFEAGSLSGWSTAGTAGSDDLFYADDTNITPLNGFPTAGPDTGSWYAVSDMTGLVAPESSYLTQAVTIPKSFDIVLSFDIFVNDVFGSSGAGGEVGIWANGANPLTATPLFVVYGPSDTAAPNGSGNPWKAVSVAVTADLTAGVTYQFGVLESDSTGPINVGVDNLSLVTVPEPATLLPSALLLAGLFVYRVRCKAVRCKAARRKARGQA